MVRKRNVVILCCQTFVLESFSVLEQLYFKYLLQNRLLPKIISGKSDAKASFNANLSKSRQFLLKRHSTYRGRLQKRVMGSRDLHRTCLLISDRHGNRWFSKVTDAWPKADWRVWYPLFSETLTVKSTLTTYRTIPLNIPKKQIKASNRT